MAISSDINEGWELIGATLACCIPRSGTDFGGVGVLVWGRDCTGNTSGWALPSCKSLDKRTRISQFTSKGGTPQARAAANLLYQKPHVIV